MLLGQYPVRWAVGHDAPFVHPYQSFGVGQEFLQAVFYDD
jgi:hypothetical protein